MALSKDQILQADDLEHRTVSVPEWNGEVIVRAMTGRERDSYEQSLVTLRPALDATGKPIPGRMETVRDASNLRAKVVVRCLIDDKGSRLFKDTDAGALGAKSAAVLDRLFDVCAELSRLNDEDVEEEEGKSAAAQSGASTSASPATSESPASASSSSG